MRTALRAAAFAALALLAGCGWFGGRPDAEPAAAAASPASHATLKYEPAPVPPRQFFER